MKLSILISYGGQISYASNIELDTRGNISIEYAHDIEGCLDSEHVKIMRIEVTE